jgi:uncharacterized protein YndB with AHSA1/START domain
MIVANAVPIIIGRNFAFAPERVFDAWLDPAIARGFLFATPKGTLVRVDIDARVGGGFTITRRDGGDVDHIGSYLEIDRPRRLVFTFGVPKFSSTITRVELHIQPESGGCELTLTHYGVDAEWSDRSREGWGKILDGLAEVLGKGAGR